MTATPEHPDPNESDLTPADVQAEDPAAILDAAPTRSYTAMCERLAAAADNARDAGEPRRERVLRLFGYVCSMRLCPDTPAEPFKPLATWNGGRSAAPSDFTEEDLDLFAATAKDTAHTLLRARLSDFVQYRTPRKRVEFAQLAISAYTEAAPTAATWHKDRIYWGRAIQLALRLGPQGRATADALESALLAAFDGAGEDRLFAHSIAGMLAEHGLAKAHSTRIAAKLRGLADAKEAKAEHEDARAYYQAAALWFRRAGHKAEHAAAIVAEAESWACDADARCQSGAPMAFAIASGHYERAIQTYRAVPKMYRPEGTPERIVELMQKLVDAGERSLDEMGRHSVESDDMSDLIIEARASVTGKSAADALRALANAWTGPDSATYRAEAEQQMERVWHLFMSTEMISSDGRKIAKHSAISGDDDAAREARVQLEMVQHFGLMIGISVQGGIWPALEAMKLEHDIPLGDFVALARNAPIVPSDRAYMVGKALHEGYEHDFISAVHILVPQIENLVRYHLKQAGAVTTTLSVDGINNEVGLSALVDKAEMLAVFGADLTFELKALFRDPVGANLRNELAHGLLNENACNSAIGIYAWWLLLRLVFSSFWKVHHPDPSVEPLDAEAVAADDLDPAAPAPAGE